MKPILHDIVPNQRFRGKDAAGSGAFGASRKRKINGKWVSVPGAHKGIDIVTYTGQDIRSPIPGTIIHVGKAYSDDNRYDSIIIKGMGCAKGVTVKILYAKPNVVVGQTIAVGNVIGTAENLYKKYKGITNHVHLEVRFNNIIQNPTNLFQAACDDENEKSSIDDVKVIQSTAEKTTPYQVSQSISVDELLKTDRFRNVVVKKQQFLQFTYKNKTNHRRIYDALSNKQRKQQSDKIEYDSEFDYKIAVGTVVYIKQEWISLENLVQSNITITKSNSIQYFAPILRHLTNDPGFVPAIYNRGVDAKQIYPQLNIWLWSRALHLQGFPGWINITNDIVSATTNISLDAGGNFSITLPAKISDSTVIQTDNGVVNLGSVNKSKVYSDGENVSSEYTQPLFYYQQLIHQNDLLLISFEELDIDNDSSQIPSNKWYDMIAMVDVVGKDITAATNESSISIRGRDLIKVLTDDNSYFNPYSIGHSQSIYGGKLSDRMLNGEFKLLSAVIPRTIQQQVEFITNRIASIGYIPDEVFSQWNNKTQVVTSDLIKSTKRTNGIWQIIKVFVDDNVRQLRIIDDSIMNPKGNILQLFQKIAQRPFVEFFADTYGDKYYLNFRQPPVTQDAVMAMINQIDADDMGDFSQYKSTQSTVGTATATQKNKYKQTQQSQQKTQSKKTGKSDIIVTDDGLLIPKQGIELDEVVIKSSANFPRIININSDDVIREDLQFSNEAYAWYKITDKGNFAGNTVSLGHVPSLYFDEYAQIFGNKLLEVTSNYSNQYFFNNKNQNKQIDLYAEQAAQLLSYIVESNIYLPFTREGTITVNGDRRIKIGHWIYYRPTKEVFYVKSVSNNITISNNNIERTTTLTVERGMVKRYIREIPVKIKIKGVEKNISVSYFNIVNIDNLKQGVYDTITKGKVSNKFNYKSNMQLNSDVLQFFIRKMQFSYGKKS